MKKNNQTDFKALKENVQHCLKTEKSGENLHGPHKWKEGLARWNHVPSVNLTRFGCGVKRSVANLRKIHQNGLTYTGLS